MSKSSKVIGYATLLVSSSLIAVTLSELAARLFVPVRLVGPSVTEYDATYGRRLKRNFAGSQKTPEFTWHFTFNSSGFRGPEVPASEGHPILFLGDSFTQGYGVNDGEEFPRLVQNGLNSREPTTSIPIINAGVGNTGQGPWVKFLNLEAPQLSPCLVVLQFFWNDFDDNLRNGLFDLSSEGALEVLPIKPPSFGRKIQHLADGIPGLTSMYLFGLFRQAYHSLSSGMEPSDDSTETRVAERSNEDEITYRLTDSVLSTLQTASWPAIAVIVAVPDARSSRLEELLEAYQVQSVRVPGMSERPDLYYALDGHWNQLGHRYAANAILDILAGDRRLRQCGTPREGNGWIGSRK